METIRIDFEGKLYFVAVSVKKTFTNDVYVVEFSHPDLLNYFSSPIYFEYKNSKLVLPESSNQTELSFYNLLADNIYAQILMLH